MEAGHDRVEGEVDERVDDPRSSTTGCCRSAGTAPVLVIQLGEERDGAHGRSFPWVVLLQSSPQLKSSPRSGGAQVREDIGEIGHGGMIGAVSADPVGHQLGQGLLGGLALTGAELEQADLLA